MPRASAAEQLAWLAALILTGLTTGLMFIPALGAAIWRFTQ